MGVMVSNNQERNSELNRRIAADLHQKAQTSDSGKMRSANDAVEDYVAGTKRTGRFTWVWIILIVLAILSVIFMFFG